MERAEQLRPNCRIETETRLQWLRETDALLRTKLFDRSAAGAFDAVGADRPWEQPVQDDQPLLAPPPSGRAWTANSTAVWKLRRRYPWSAGCRNWIL